MVAMTSDLPIHDTVADPRSQNAFDETLAASQSSGAVVAPASLRSTRPSVLPRVQPIGDDYQLVHESAARYRTVKELGAGGMGEVEQADDVDIGRPVAIKRLLPDAASAANLVRFVQEVRIVGNLEHPNVVPLHDVGLDANGRYFFVMKYVNGESLERVIERLQAHDPDAEREYTFERRIEVFLGVLRALEYAHAQGVIHRDVKPANVMIGRYGEVWLMDWGVAKRIGQSDVKYTDEPKDSSPRAQIRTTRHGAIVGTPAYMAPEQARGDLDAIDARSDLYAASVMFHELLTLRHRHEDKETLQQLLEAIKTSEPGFIELLRPREGHPQPPAELVHLVRKGMKLNKDERWQSAGEMVAAIQGVLEGKVRIQCHATFTKRVARELGRFVDRHPNVGFVALLGAAGMMAWAIGATVWHFI
jgi:serine/threonine-protein kinase